MNSLTVFLWLADIVPAIGTLLIVIFGITAGLAVFAKIISHVCAVMQYVDEKEIEACHLYQRKTTKILYWTIPFLLIANVIPSQKTMYLMFGSELGEYALETETGEKVIQVINLKLDEYITEIPKTLKDNE